MRRAILEGVLVLLACAAQPVSAQAPPRSPTTTLSFVLGPGLALERWPGQSPLVPRDTKAGLSATARLAVPFGGEANLVGSASIWRGGGSELQLFAAGVEAQLGEAGHFLLGLGPALIRQAYQKVVVFYPDGTSPTQENSTLATRLGAHVWTGYTWPVSSRWEIGFHAGWAYPFKGLRRFHQLSLGVLLGAALSPIHARSIARFPPAA